MQDRLLALIALIRLSEKEQNLNAQTSTSMRNKIEKAIKNLEKVPDLTFINEKFSDETEFFLNKPVNLVFFLHLEAISYLSGREAHEERQR